MPNYPLVSCLMVTADRKDLAARSVLCFLRQTYPNKELVVIDDGEQDYSDLFKDIPPAQITYHKRKKSPDLRLGGLRNLALDLAKGDYLMQWDDDDWYHEDRITIQANVLIQGHDACCLSSSLNYIHHHEYEGLPFRGGLRHGVPGTIVHVRNDSIRYTNDSKGEDTIYLHHWRQLRYQKMADPFSYLFLRCYHGSNTWEFDHFKRRMKNGPLKLISYMWFKHVRRDLSLSPLFKLDHNELNSIQTFRSDSTALKLM